VGSDAGGVDLSFCKSRGGKRREEEHQDDGPFRDRVAEHTRSRNAKSWRTKIQVAGDRHGLHLVFALRYASAENEFA
jgi:hypothetical protein